MSDETPPPPPSEDSVPPEGLPPPPVSAEPPLQTARGRRSFWSKLGGEGLTISIIVHAVLILIAAIWVISTVTDSVKKDPDSFATGAGGGNAGDRAKNQPHKVVPKNAKTLAKNAARITSRNANAAISLPDLPVSSSAAMMSGMTAGGSSKGFGGGSGGGIGSGMGVGVGNGRNFVGKSVMGAKIFAVKIAVFMDASGSMSGYLDRVEAEIRKQFPDADVYCYNGLFITVQDGVVLGGEHFRGQPVRTSGVGVRETDQKKLSGTGKNLYKKFDENFKQGSAGAWIDIMRQQRNYDALVLFSDFQDGVTQFRMKGEKVDKNVQGGGFPIVYYDGIRADVARGNDSRKPAEKRWEEEWLKSFSDAKDGKGPRLYCFSTEQEPQPLLTKCVTASGGQIKMVTWLRTGGQPPEDPPATAAAGAPAGANGAMPAPAAGVPLPAPKAYKPPR
jgi:hypothetical protein